MAAVVSTANNGDVDQQVYADRLKVENCVNDSGDKLNAPPLQEVEARQSARTVAVRGTRTL
jgi:hypothetical protein